MVLGFLAIESERHIAPAQRRMAGKGDRGRCGQGNALVGGPEQHIEVQARVHQRLRVELCQAAYGSARIEKARIKKIGADPPRFDFELPKTQDSLIQGETHEIRTIGRVSHHSARKEKTDIIGHNDPLPKDTTRKSMNERTLDVRYLRLM